MSRRTHGEMRTVRVILWLLCSSALMCARTVHAQYTGAYQTNIISGVASNWSGDYVVGYGAPLPYHFSYDVLLIQNGAVLSDTNGAVGLNSSDNLAMVSGTGSIWNNSGDLSFGGSGIVGNQLIITNGGTVYDNNGFVGQASLQGGGYHTVLVTGSGSVWSNRNSLLIEGE